MRYLIPILVATCLCGADIAPKPGTDTILDAAIAVSFPEKAQQDIAYQVLADYYAIDADEGKTLRTWIIGRKLYGLSALQRDGAVIGLRGAAREKALAAYDAKQNAAADAELAKLKEELAAQQAAAKQPTP